MKKSPIYTGGGDKGTTSLVGGVRVPKTHPRLEAYGTIDELNSQIGLLIAETDDQETADLLRFVQHKLFTVGSYLATDMTQTDLRIESNVTPESIRRLEEAIDRYDTQLPRMRGFVLPGGNRTSALAHVCRTVCRRAERRIYRLTESATVEEPMLIFMNRLSDLLFVIGRNECVRKNNDEILWDSACS
ncbi:MAG: cob(I)yrinic acid a,c-diamide adenosyltransferase [Tannerella forsythia]|uniref:cob(I)yrinic acid a,c-diamide adenosyltransferase n=1 Tax=Tannerella forsythia TaxID=28112 RepID=UPI00360B2A50